MRSIDDILAAAHKAMDASLREAYEAGRAHNAAELKARMAAFFDGLVAESKSHSAPGPVNNSQHHDDHRPQGDHHHRD